MAAVYSSGTLVTAAQSHNIADGNIYLHHFEILKYYTKIFWIRPSVS